MAVSSKQVLSFGFRTIDESARRTLENMGATIDNSENPNDSHVDFPQGTELTDAYEGMNGARNHVIRAICPCGCQFEYVDETWGLRLKATHRCEQHF